MQRVFFVGVQHGSDGRQCNNHSICCGEQVEDGSTLHIRHYTKKQCHILALYFVDTSKDPRAWCKVGFLKSIHTKNWKALRGKYVRVVDIYGEDDTDIDRRLKVRQNYGFGEAILVPSSDVWRDISK
jgi:hypothetical protein